MEYQMKKESLLQNVEYSNLLSFTLVENKLERNFKSIVEALLLNQNKADDMTIKMDQLEDKLAEENKQQMQDLKGIKELLREFNDRIGKLEDGKSHHALPEVCKETNV